MLKQAAQLKVNSHLDDLARAEIHLFRKAWSAFHVCGLTALALAVISVMTLVRVRGLSAFVMLAIIVAVPFTVCVLGMCVKIVTGEEQYAQYHHFMAITVITMVLVWLLHQPVLPYLDITILGIGLTVIVGRIGCFMVGCCHGRPSRWGVCYRHEHAEAGFAPYYVGIRLFPVQLIESVWTLLIVGAGAVLFRGGQPSGGFLAWYVVTYCLGRFWIEFLRGGPGRPYLFGYSEAQWISFSLICLVVGLEYAGVLPRSSLHPIAAASVLVAMIGIAWKRSFQCATARELLYPDHIKEVAEAVEFITARAADFSPRHQWSVFADQTAEKQISVASTSLGIQLSASKNEKTYHYAFSHCDGGMTRETAKLLAQLILTLRRANSSSEIRSGSRGVFHLFIYS